MLIKVQSIFLKNDANLLINIFTFENKSNYLNHIIPKLITIITFC